MPPASPMVTLLCAGCGALVAHVRDTRFGLAPAASVCPACAHPAQNTQTKGFF